MSTASAAPAAAAPAASKGGNKKKLLIIVAAVVALLVVGGGAAAFLVMKNRAAAEAAAADDDEAAPKKREAKAPPVKDAKHAPAFMPLDPFTVNLADRNADRYAQIAITLELSDPAQADVIKAYMPAVRNNVLMLLSHKTSAELLEHDGKLLLAEQIRKETARALGFEIDDEDDSSKKKRRRAPAELPVAAVHFGTFIIQ